MKLLPSREIKSEKQSSALAESMRLTEVRSELSREERALNQYKLFVFEESEKIKTDFDAKILAWNQELTKIEDEVKLLKAERDILLEPLDDVKNKITENLAVSDEMLKYLDKRKKEVLSEKSKLEKNNREVEKQLGLLLEREHHLNERELSIAERDELSQSRLEDTARNAEQFATQANKRNIELMLYEERIHKTEVELAEREKLIARDKEQIVKDRIRIESQQQTLIAAYAEGKKNNII